jgi:hypothetical protein
MRLWLGSTTIHREEPMSLIFVSRSVVLLTIRRADATKPVTLNFNYDHRNP